MENLTFKNYQDFFAKAIVAKAKKLVARDIEEVEPNKFVAYVDEGNQSYDVAIEFEKEQIKNLSCDCEKGTGFCAHKVSLINLIKNNNPEKKSVAKRKKSDSELLLEQLDESNLRIWVQELFKKNKDFELLFVTEFSKQELVFTKPEIKIIIDKAIKSVIKNKRSVDATELKRIIEVLDVSLQPVLKFCKETIALPETNDVLVSIYSELIEFNYDKNVSGIKMIRFIEKIYKEINHYIHNIKEKELWQSVVEETIHYFFYKKMVYEMEMEVLYHLYESIDNKDRKAFFASVLFDVFTINVNLNLRYVKRVNVFFIKAFSENNLFEKMYMHFSPMIYENDYNILLIEKLIEIEKYDVAESIVLEQISRNSNDKYNIGYYKLLKEIYAITNNVIKNALLNMKTIFYDFSLENYKLIEQYCEESEFKKFRTKLLTAFKRNFYDSQKSVRAYFEIIYYDKKFKNMIDNISEYSTYEMIFDYKEDLYLFDKTSFLLALTKIEGNGYFSYRKDINIVEYREKLIHWIKEKYDSFTINAIVKSKKHYYNSAFIQGLEN